MVRERCSSTGKEAKTGCRATSPATRLCNPTKGVQAAMKRAMIVSLALILVLSAVAMADGIGAFSAFKNGVGARALAMGGAFVAVADDATAACWNPAGLALLNDTRLAGMSLFSGANAGKTPTSLFRKKLKLPRNTGMKKPITAHCLNYHMAGYTKKQKSLLTK